MSKETATIPKKKPKLRPKEKHLADVFLDTGNGTEAAMQAYDAKNRNVASVIATRVLGKASVKEYLELNSEAVASNMVHLALNAEKQSDQISAGKDVLDRAGYKPVDKFQTVTLHIEASADELEKLQQVAGRSLLEIEDD